MLVLRRAFATASAANSGRRVIVYGGGGELGRAVVKKFNALNWRTLSADFARNAESHESVVLDSTKPWSQHAAAVLQALEGDKVDTVVHTAGGWVGGTIGNGLFAKADKMWEFNVRSALCAAHVAANSLKAGGLVVFTGAAGARDPTPDMIEYGISKAAVHHLARSLADKKSGLPAGAKSVVMLPHTIDTVANRKAMPKGKFSSWTPPEVFAEHVAKWAQDPSARSVENGGMYVFTTKDGQTSVSCELEVRPVP